MTPKTKGHSTRLDGKQDYTPDLCFASSSLISSPMQIKRQVLNGFPHSQHRPIIYKIGIQIPVLHSIPKPRRNSQKADWESFGKYSDANIRWIKPVPENYERFCGLIKSAAKRSIPRGFRKEYVPGWNEETSRLAAEFEKNNSQETATELL